MQNAISYNWNPDRVCFVDIETQSAVNLRVVGSRRYLRDPSTRLLSAVAMIDDTVIVWIPTDRAPPSLAWGDACWPSEWQPSPVSFHIGAMPQSIADAISSDTTFVAHNASSFDAEGWLRLVGGDQPAWYDTLPKCRAAGLPGGLDALGKQLIGRGKQEDGKKLIDLMCKARVSRGHLVYPVGTEQVWRRLISYNISDVLLLREVYHATRDSGESDVLAADSDINSRGCPVDLSWARILRNLWEAHQCEAREEIDELSDGELQGDDARSVPKVQRWLRKQGLIIPSLRKDEINLLLSDPDGYFGDTDDPAKCRVAALLRARQTAARAVVGKVERVFLAADDDDRVRGMHVYNKAHTGRWAGRELQPHNMPRGVAKLDVETIIETCYAAKEAIADERQRVAVQLLAVKQEAERCNATVADALATLFRPIVAAPLGHSLAIADFAAIEARGVAWIAGDDAALDVFRSDADPYCRMATAVCGREIGKSDKTERQLGKVISLACGFGMGAAKFNATANLQGVDLAEANTTAEHCVATYRAAHPAIVRLWKDIQRGVERLLKGEGKAVKRIGRCLWTLRNSDMIVTLPSGRKLIYRQIRGDSVDVEWQGKRWKGTEITCWDNRGFRKKLYGGLLTENIVQAICRDLLAAALVRERDRCVLHVHDEIVDCVPTSGAGATLHRLTRDMSIAPEWAQGFPIKVEGFVSPRYVKSAFRGAAECIYADGREIVK